MRNALCFLGLTALVAPGVAACSGDDSAAPLGASSDAGVDATAADGGGASDAAGDSPSAADVAASDAGEDADAGSDAAASDSAPPVRASVRLADGAGIFGVTADEQVVYWSDVDAGIATATVSAVSGDGGAPLVLSTTVLPIERVVVAGSTAVWLDSAGADAGSCPLPSRALHSWSSAHGASTIAPFAAVGGEGYGAAVNADGSEVAYVPGCTFPTDAGGLVYPNVALASTDGAGSRLSAAIAQPPLDFRLYVNGTTVTMEGLGTTEPGWQAVFAGGALAQTISALPPGDWANPTAAWIDPSGTWVWAPVPPTETDSGSGMQLLQASNGDVLFTDLSASSAAGLYEVPYAFDATGSTLFYQSSSGVKTIAPASSTTPVSLAGCEALVAAAPNGGAALCLAGLGTPDVTVLTVSAGATQTTATIPATNYASTALSFLPDSTLVWLNGTTLFSEPTLGGPVLTVATSVSSWVSVGGSQVAVFQPSGVEIVDATGALPAFELSPAPSSAATLFAAPSGGFVAYPAGGAIYAVQTR